MLAFVQIFEVQQCCQRWKSSGGWQCVWQVVPNVSKAQRPFETSVTSPTLCHIPEALHLCIFLHCLLLEEQFLFQMNMKSAVILLNDHLPRLVWQSVTYIQVYTHVYSLSHSLHSSRQLRKTHNRCWGCDTLSPMLAELQMVKVSTSLMITSLQWWVIVMKDTVYFILYHHVLCWCSRTSSGIIGVEWPRRSP